MQQCNQPSRTALTHCRQPSSMNTKIRPSAELKAIQLLQDEINNSNNTSMANQSKIDSIFMNITSKIQQRKQVQHCKIMAELDNLHQAMVTHLLDHNKAPHDLTVINCTEKNKEHNIKLARDNALTLWGTNFDLLVTPTHLFVHRAPVNFQKLARAVRRPAAPSQYFNNHNSSNLKRKSSNWNARWSRENKR